MAVRIINIGVFLRWVLTFPDMFVLRLARSDFGLPFLPFFAPFSFFLLYFCVPFWQVFRKKSLVIPDAMPGWFSFSPSLSFFLLPWRFHERTPAIWRWKGWNHPDSCPATELLKLPDKAVRLHFGSNCQSKLALPFTINKRQCKVSLQPVSEPSNCSPFQMC